MAMMITDSTEGVKLRCGGRDNEWAQHAGGFLGYAICQHRWLWWLREIDGRRI